MLTARWAASWSAAKARRLSPSSSGVSPAATITVPSVVPAASIATRTACPVPFWVLLDGEHHAGGQRLDVRADLLALVSDHGDDVQRVDGLHGREDVADHAPATDRVEDLHGLRLHAGAPARSEDDHGQVLRH